jgi:hypothetical protein
MCLDGICDNLYKSSTCIEITFYLVYDVESIFSTTHKRKEVNTKSYMATVIRYKHYKFESRSFMHAQFSL